MHPHQPHTRGAFEPPDPIEQESARPDPMPRRNATMVPMVVAALVLAGILILVVLI